MTTSSEEFVRRLHEGDDELVLVRNRSPPVAVDDDVVRFESGSVAVHRGDGWEFPLFVTSETGDGRTRKRFDRLTAIDAIEYAERATRNYAPDGVWFVDHAEFTDYISFDAVRGFESRLADVASEVGATLVTWSDADTYTKETAYDRVVEA